MWSSFGLMNLRFGIYLFGAIMMFAGAWLYFDAAKERKNWQVLFRSLGMMLLGLGFVGEAVRTEGVGLTMSGWMMMVLGVVETVRLLGYLVLTVGVFGESLTQRPKLNSWWIIFPKISLPAAAALAGVVYLRRASVGLERHLLRPALGLLVLSVAEALGWYRLFADTADVGKWELVRPYGVMWGMQLVVCMIGFGILSSWVFSYLLKRFETQLVLIISGLVVGICLATTMVFSGMMLEGNLGRVEKVLLSQTQSVSYAMEQRIELLANDAAWVAADERLGEGIENGIKKGIEQVARGYMENRKPGGISVLDKSGTVLVSFGDSRGVGMSLSNDRFVKKSVKGEVDRDVVVEKRGDLNQLVMVASAPIRVGTEVVGVVRIEDGLDETFVEMVEKKLGVSVLIVIEDTVVTTSEDRRVLGAKLAIEDGVAVERVLNNQSLVLVKKPVVDSFGQVLGGLVGVESVRGLLNEVGEATMATFGVAILLILITQLPAMMIASYITKQLR